MTPDKDNNHSPSSRVKVKLCKVLLIGFSIAVDLITTPTIYSITGYCGVSAIR
jgi:hypothetical protein